MINFFDKFKSDSILTTMKEIKSIIDQTLKSETKHDKAIQCQLERLLSLDVTSQDINVNLI